VYRAYAEYLLSGESEPSSPPAGAGPAATQKGS
jgi:hypothetical protein